MAERPSNRASESRLEARRDARPLAGPESGAQGPRASRPQAQSSHEQVLGALHDVSNALTVMLGWIATARESDARDAREHALAMAEHGARVARDLARRAIGAGAGAGDVEASLDSAIREAVDALEVEAQRAGVQIVVGASVPSVRVPSSASVSQVLTNLLLNALAFAPRGTTVSLDARLAHPAIIVEVQDRGPGVDPSRAAAIFDGSSTREGGAGVGLRYSRAIARSVGGDLELAESEGRGARFRLTWPASIGSMRPPPDMPSKPHLLAGTRVLVVEDDADVASLLETALGARGAHVTIAPNAEALRIAAEEPHDAALLDLSPIAADVHGAIARLRARSPEVHLVFISGSAVGLPDALNAPGQPARWVRKPFEMREIVEALVGVGRKRAST